MAPLFAAHYAEMTLYIHRRLDWPAFTFRDPELSALLAVLNHRRGRLAEKMENLALQNQSEAVVQVFTEDVIQSSAIEGETLSRVQVRSSVARRMGVEIGALAPVDRTVDGVVEMMLDATQNHAARLTAERLFGWHAALFPTGRSGLRRIRVGAWRDKDDAPMQVVSGPLGRERVHFQAPDGKRVRSEMKSFLHWFNTQGAFRGDPLVRSGIAHLWFITIHPFEDGIGRIARAITDMALAHADASPKRYYSMSAQIRNERSQYYAQLERAQKGTLDITEWLLWFLECMNTAVGNAELILGNVLRKARYWEIYGQVSLSSRQQSMLTRLIDGFEGKLTSSKWAKLAKCSQDTAGRDIADLVHRGVLLKDAGGGRSTSYSLRPLA
jgi:Fic family protein